MPEVQFTVRWPDHSVDRCYSPSTIIKNYLENERDYPLVDFIARCRCGFAAANERVRQRYGGSGCSRARAQLAFLEEKAAQFDEPFGDGAVRVEGLAP